MTCLGHVCLDDVNQLFHIGVTAGSKSDFIPGDGL